MSTPVSAVVNTASGVTWMDICPREGVSPKTLKTITEDDWMRVGGFREGTFNFAGDEMTVTSQKYENGTEITSSVQAGTEGFEGDLANLAKEVCKLLLKCEDVDVTGATTGAWVEGKTVIGGGKVAGVVDDVFVRLRFEDSPKWEAIVYPKCKLSSRITGAGASTDLLNIHVIGSAAASTDVDTLDMSYVLVEKK